MRPPKTSNLSLITVTDPGDKSYQVTAFYVNSFTVEADCHFDNPANCEFNEDDQTYYLAPGWYQHVCNTSPAANVKITLPVKRWEYLS
jgi:hypothetical protein